MSMHFGILSFHLLYGLVLVQCQIEYHYVDIALSWKDAQQYCREHYIDLATLENAEDVNRLHIPSGTLAWIGLSDDPASWKGVMTSDSNSWKWSSTGTTSPGGYKNWASGQPDNSGGKELCVYIQNGFWIDQNCASPLHFFCYTVQPSGLKQYILITTPKTWSDSQSYCKRNYHDLATIETSAENQAVTNLLSTTTTSVWIGLYRISWRWSNGSPSTYRKWSPGEPNNSGSEFCVYLSSSLTWNDEKCPTLERFVCQGGIKTLSAKIKVTLQTEADMLNPVVHQSFLKALKKNLGSGFSTSWNIPPTKEAKKSKNVVCNLNG